MNYNFTNRDLFLLRLSAMIGRRTAGSDFVALGGKVIKTMTSRISPLLMYANLDTNVDGKFAFFSLSKFLSFIDGYENYNLMVNVDKHKCRVEANNKIHNQPVLVVNEYYDPLDLDIDQQDNPIYMNSAINSDKYIIDNIKKIKDEFIYKFKLSIEKVEDILNDTKKIGAKVLGISGKDGIINLKLLTDLKDDNGMDIEFEVDGETKGDIEVNIPFFNKIFNGDMTIYVCEHETLLIDNTNSVFYITNSIDDVEASDKIVVDYDLEEFDI